MEVATGFRAADTTSQLRVTAGYYFVRAYRRACWPTQEPFLVPTFLRAAAAVAHAPGLRSDHQLA